ncbi:unnamed protein product [Dibothriocephalus latus]|uniref:Uncharacterized protein n=1 Tax=Dibothriocephalus latus TaxID=60516 RepID=A0A3P6T0J7_DIBLA|nr:unnamed protein product [Dibothriocephalus latus]
MEQDLPIFKEIRDSFGQLALQNVRHWEWAVIRTGTTKEQLYFLHSCVRNNLFPKSVHYKPPVQTNRAREIARTMSKKMLQELITDAHKRLEKYTAAIYYWREKCAELLSDEWISKLDKAIEKQMNVKRKIKRERLNQKLENMKRSDKENRKNVEMQLENLCISPRSALNIEIEEEAFNSSPDTEDLPSFAAALQLSLQDEGQTRCPFKCHQGGQSFSNPHPIA